MGRLSPVMKAIEDAERVLPGRAKDDPAKDLRWPAIIKVGGFIETDPLPVCVFALKWARRPGADLQGAISCCLLEHLLEHHFDLVFPLMRKAARENRRVAEHFTDWRWPFGQATLPKNVARLRRLAYEVRRRYDPA
jgi:hypothetical protein